MKRQPLFKLEIEKTSAAKASFIGFWALILIAVVCFAGLAFPNFSYNLWTFPFVLAFVAALIGCSFSKKTPFVRLLLIVIGALGAGFFMVLINFPAINVLAVLSLPLLTVAFLTVFYKLIQVSQKKSSKLFGQSLMYVGIMVLLIGVFVSAGAKNTQTVTDVKPNTSVESLGVMLEISNFTVSNSQSKVNNEQLDAVVPEYSSISTSVTVHYLGKTYQNSLIASFYSNYGLIIRPLILTTETGDVYLHLEYSDSMYETLTQRLIGNDVMLDNAVVTVQTSPLIYLVWTGVALMVLSISLQLVIDIAQKKP